MSTEEKSLLLEVVARYKQVIENKQTDRVSAIEKNKVWCSVESDFNSCGTIKRSAKQLKEVRMKFVAFDFEERLSLVSSVFCD